MSFPAIRSTSRSSPIVSMKLWFVMPPASGSMVASRPGHRRATMASASVRAIRGASYRRAAGRVRRVGARGYHRNVDADPLQPLLSARLDVVPGGVRRADARAGGAPGTPSRRGRRHAGGRADRVGEDAGRVPVGARPPGGASRRPIPPQRLRVLYVSPLKALAVDIERNLRAPLAGMRAVAERDGGVPRPTSTWPSGPATRPQEDRRRFAEAPARHPDHHARVAVPDPDVAGPRGAARRRDRDRRRGARGRRNQARRAPGAVARAARRAARPAGAADRAVGDGPPARGGRPVPRRAARPVVDRGARPRRRRFDLSVVVPVEDMTEPAGSVRRCRGAPRPRSARASGRRSTSGWSS